MDQKLNRSSKIRVSYEVSTDAKIIGREEERRGGKMGAKSDRCDFFGGAICNGSLITDMD